MTIYPTVIWKLHLLFLWLGILPSTETTKRRDSQNRLEGKTEPEQCGITDAGHPSTRYIHVFTTIL